MISFNINMTDAIKSNIGGFDVQLSGKKDVGAIGGSHISAIVIGKHGDFNIEAVTHRLNDAT